MELQTSLAIGEIEAGLALVEPKATLGAHLVGEVVGPQSFFAYAACEFGRLARVKFFLLRMVELV